MFSITYEIVTDESAEHGDVAESGFEMENATLREAWEFLRWHGSEAVEASDSDISAMRWVTFYNSPEYESGNYTNYSLHLPDGLTKSTRRRIARMFRCYGFK